MAAGPEVSLARGRSACTVVPVPMAAVDREVAARLLGEAIDHREPEPGSRGPAAWCEERLERPLEHLRGHARAGVGRPRASRSRPARPRIARASASRAATLRSRSSARPPSGMASRALITRLSSACSSWRGIDAAWSSRSGRERAIELDASPSVRRSSSLHARRSASFRSTRPRLAASGCARTPAAAGSGWRPGRAAVRDLVVRRRRPCRVSSSASRSELGGCR